MNYSLFPILSHIIKFLAKLFNKIWFGLHYSIVLKLFGIVILDASSLLLLFKYIKLIANKEAGAVTCKFTLGPYFTLDALFSFIWNVLVILWGGYIILPPSINLINLYSNCKSLKVYFLSLIPKQIIPNAQPAANEYPSLYKHLSDLGNFPIWDKAVSVIVRLHDPLWSNPKPIKALAWTFIGISTSIEGGSKAGICKNKALVKD